MAGYISDSCPTVYHSHCQAVTQAHHKSWLFYETYIPSIINLPVHWNERCAWVCTLNGINV